jgi:small nuclear ribonucleoprotein (snRNP)-like protein
MARGQRKGLTLLVYLQACQGSKVVVELHRDTIIRGVLVSVDKSLNMYIDNATITLINGTRREVATVMYVRGSAVRFIHLPGNLEPAAAIETQRRRTAQALRERAAQQASIPRLAKGQDYTTGE